MKTIVSNRYRLNIISMFVITTICNSILLGWGFSLSNDFIEFLPLLGFAFLFYAINLLVVFIGYRGLLTVYLSDTEFISKFYKKTYCVVDKSKPVYYIRFRAKDDLLLITEYIVISNERICWTKNPDTILSKYHMKTQIVLPYNNQTKKFIDLENWIVCYPQKKKFFI